MTFCVRALRVGPFATLLSPASGAEGRKSWYGLRQHATHASPTRLAVGFGPRVTLGSGVRTHSPLTKFGSPVLNLADRDSTFRSLSRATLHSTPEIRAPFPVLEDFLQKANAEANSRLDIRHPAP